MFESELNRREPFLEWPILAAIAGLMFVGIAFIYSATSIYETVSLWQRFRESTWRGFFLWLLPQSYSKQMLAYGIGLCLAVAFCLVDYHRLARWSLVIYWGSILLLAAVLIEGIGVNRYGARRWIDFGFFQFQPSEFAKICFLLAMANFLSRPAEELRQPALFAKALGLIVLPFLLILKEPDLGSALVLIPVGLVMMYVAGIPALYLKRLLIGGSICIGFLVLNVLFAPEKWQVPIKDYQRDRLLVYFGKDFAPRDATPAERQRARERQQQQSYNVEQALISVGSGGWLGKGWRQGTQNALGFLPRGVAHNDFIFSVVAEEKGFLGSVIVLSLYAILLFAGIKIATLARDRLGKLVAVGVVTLLFTHVFINIGMNIRLMPVTGIPLPLVSYGGTSVICSLIAIGVLQNIYIYRKSY